VIYFKLVCLFSIGIFSKASQYISNWYLLKPSWKLRGEFHSGGVLLSQRKSIWISNLENASRNLIHIPLTICKNILKRLSKIICKNKISGANVVQNIKRKKANHAYLVKVKIGLIPCNLCTYIMQTSSILHLYICFGLCWHQSPKRGRLKLNLFL
jgi:hypothetical protein